MKLTSNLKVILGDDLLRLTASVCDSRKYPSNQQKMFVVCKLLKMHDINYSILGPATNRLSVLINGYAVKFALDAQGYKDNFIEYAISSELQPDVTKSYETNGYTLVAEYVNQMTIEEFRLRKDEILRKLANLGDNYLLGDVGYDSKNYTNWGTRDDGSLVILDYAYVHRATENLFTCERCGSLLSYDINYTTLMCINRANGCNARYSYNDRKAFQGDQVDYDMIDDVKENHSIVIGPGETSKEVIANESTGEVYDGDVVVVHNRVEYERYLNEEENSAIKKDFDSLAAFDLLIAAMRERQSGNDETADELEKELSEIMFEKKVPRKMIFSPDYRLDEDEIPDDEEDSSAPDPIVFYDAEYGYPNSYESLGFEDSAKWKKEYKERANQENKNEMEENDMALDMKDLLEILNGKDPDDTDNDGYENDGTDSGDNNSSAPIEIGGGLKFVVTNRYNSAPSQNRDSRKQPSNAAPRNDRNDNARQQQEPPKPDKNTIYLNGKAISPN